MPRLYLIVEGDGERAAAPVLVRRLLHETLGRFDWVLLGPAVAGGTGTLRKDLGRLIERAAIARVDAILVLADSEGDCPVDTACALRALAAGAAVRPSVTVVVAHSMYEAWFLADLDAVRSHMPLTHAGDYPDEVEQRKSPKRWICRNLPQGQTYKETRDQARITGDLDLSKVEQRSRSFRRLRHALQELVTAADDGQRLVSPTRCPMTEGLFHDTPN